MTFSFVQQRDISPRIVGPDRFINFFVELKKQSFQVISSDVRMNEFVDFGQIYSKFQKKTRIF